MKRIFLAMIAALGCGMLMASGVAEFTAADGGEYRVTAGGKLTDVEVISPVADAAVALKRVWRVEYYTNAVAEAAVTNIAYTAAFSNAYLKAAWTNTYHTLSFVDEADLVGYTTNVEVTVTTNVTRSLDRVVAITNTLVSGTCTGGLFSAKIEGKQFFAAGDRVIFSGSADGAKVRMVFE